MTVSKKMFHLRFVAKNFSLIALFATSLFNPSYAEAASQLSEPKKPLISNLTSMTKSASQEMIREGLDFLKEMSNSADNLKSYSFVSQMSVFKNGKTIEEQSQFFYKKPRMIRAEELGPYKKGAVAVLAKNGKVKGHLGGLMSKFVATVDADSEWVRSANDYPLVDSDFLSMTQVMLNFVKEGKKCIVTETPVDVTGQANKAYILELYTDSSKKELLKRAYIDPNTLLPIEWFDYKAGQLFAHTRWKDVKLNIDLNDSLFNL